jgi:hypothetical protein
VSHGRHLFDSPAKTHLSQLLARVTTTPTGGVKIAIAVVNIHNR